MTQFVGDDMQNIILDSSIVLHLQSKHMKRNLALRIGMSEKNKRLIADPNISLKTIWGSKMKKLQELTVVGDPFDASQQINFGPLGDNLNKNQKPSGKKQDTSVQKPSSQRSKSSSSQESNKSKTSNSDNNKSPEDKEDGPEVEVVASEPVHEPSS